MQTYSSLQVPIHAPFTQSSNKFEHTLPLISNLENHYLPREVHFTTFPLRNFEIKTEVSLDFTCNEELL